MLELIYGHLGGLFENTVTPKWAKGDFWLRCADSLTKRSKSKAVSVGKNIYVVGGVDSKTTQVTTECYNVDSNEWTTKANIPTPRTYGFGWSALNDKIYCFGGRNTNNSQVATNECYDVSSNTWSTKAPMPTATGDMSGSAFVGNVAYTMGGYDNTSAVYRYDSITDSWTTEPNAATSMWYRASIVSHDKYVYVIGGSGSSSKTYRYDTVNKTWEAKAGFGSDRYYPAAVVCGDYIYSVCGTYSNSYDYIKVLSVYDIANDTWNDKATPLTNRSNHGIALVDGKIYCVNGIDKNDTGSELNLTDCYII